MDNQTKPRNINIRFWDVWMVYVKDSPQSPQIMEREHRTYYSEEEARRECARLESETTYHVILRKGTTTVRPS